MVHHSYPDVSVVIPTRNRAHMLGRALRSALAQTTQPSEIIVVDDGSSDESRLVVEAFGSDLVRYVSHENQQGASAARNAGVDLARSELLAFLDDDDEWLPEKLEKMSAVMSRSSPEVCAVYCGVHVIGPSNEVASTWTPGREPRVIGDFLQSTGFMTSVPIIRRDCLTAVGSFDEDLPGGQDFDLWIRLAQHYAFVPVPAVLVRHHIHGGQITTDRRAKLLSKRAVLEKHRTLFERHPAAYAHQLERLGMLNCANGLFDEGRECFRQSLCLDPTRETAREHLRQSTDDMEAHQHTLLRKVFSQVEGIGRFY